MNKKFELFTLTTKDGQNNHFLLTPIELKEYIDFEVKRMYYLTHPTGDSGQHCHYIEKEFFVMVQGRCIAVIDRGGGKEEFSLIAPTTAIYVPNYVWHGFKNFSKDAILLALTSTNYNKERSDYLEDYEKYLTFRKKLKENIYGL